MQNITPEQRQYAVEQFLYQVSDACDSQDWDRYLGYFTEDAEFHVPQWRSEHEYTQNPKREMSLIYYASRSGLEDRVFRIRTGKSAACTPMPRTLHLIDNVRCQAGETDQLAVSVNWVTHYYRFGESRHFFGRANYRLCWQGEQLKIAGKHVLLLNDKIDSVLDFYHL
ncbi:benzene 1,2-dioxygenase [Chania multitudinisentens RB-25]|uniref:Benzene 1,2-dioxygenase n=1 Tax=Chania multitudinisentens RB-25 TaxID=1441930 RepID=W0L425_9GAMM|nr:anthranilate 1,2-dioxygenase small subunit [Chania multitudinisentens]AHG18431.1 benzene 1,2-dioxygenase [Chania multitudinisentens RB-25]